MANFISQLKNIPTKMSDLDQLGKKIIYMNPNHNSKEYTDLAYRNRRLEIGKISLDHKMGQKIKEVEYTDREHETWRKTLKILHPLHQDVMTLRFLQNMKELETELRFSSAIPKINDLSAYLKAKTGFQIKPVAGMIDQREFLNCLAFKVFCSGQFIRHHQCIDFTSEPDLIHEYVGHVPMFADPEIAQLSQQIGMMSLGACDQDIKRLGYTYLYTIELGLCLEKGQHKAFGAGIAACAYDLKKIASGQYPYQKFDPQIDCLKEVADFQKPFECFYLSQSIKSATQAFFKIGNKIRRQFECKYDFAKDEVKIVYD